MLVLTLGLAAAALAAEVEVNPGDDIIALTASLAPGSSIVFNDGTYDIPGTLDWTGAGTADAGIVLRAKEGATPILRMSDSWATAYLHDAQYWTIDGLTFTGHPDYAATGEWYRAFYAENVSNVTITNCRFVDVTGTAVDLVGNNTAVTFTYNELGNVEDGNGLYVGCGDASCATTDSDIGFNWIHDIRGEHSGLYVEPGATNVSIHDNVIYNVTGYGLRTASTEYSDPNRVTGNVIWNAIDAGMVLSGAVVAQNNIVFNIDGIGLYLGRSGDRPFENVAVSFNTVVNTTDDGVYLDDFGTATGMVFANNVVANPTGYALDVSDDGLGEAYLRNNALTGLVQDLDPTTGAFFAGGGYGDFEDVESWDFYPTANSLLLDAADPSGEAYVPETDFNGSTRDGAAPDVGAYEVVGSGNPGWRIQEGFKELGAAEGVSEEVGGCGCGKKKNAEDTGEAALLLLLPAGWMLRRRRG